MEVKTLKRIFMWGTKTLEDPNPSMTVIDVAKYFGQQYPELLNSTIIEDKIEGDEVH